VQPSDLSQPASADDDRPWTIAEMAQEFGVTHRTLRYYEAQGLLAPDRRGTQRLFRARDRVRLTLVLRGRRLGFDLAEIAHIVDMYDQPLGERGQLNHLLDQIGRRRAQLEQRRHDIVVTLNELDDVEARCRATLAELPPAISQPPTAPWQPPTT
jgi:DNA-binding transcriptional MerR regulator